MDSTNTTYRRLLAAGRQRLEAAGIETAALDAAVLLAHAAGFTRTTLYARLPERAAAGVVSAYEDTVTRRASGMPVAYLVGEKEFLGLAFVVTPATLVPRPETELLVIWAEQWFAAHPDVRRVVDVGTGSGAIAVSLAARNPMLQVVTSDTSMNALDIARANARRHGVDARVHLVRGDLLAWLGKSVALVLANLPYLTDAQSDDAGIAAEPRIALAGGDADGFALYRRLIPQVANRLASDGAFSFEIDPGQDAIAREVSREAFPEARITGHNDLAGLPRFISIEK